MIVMKLQFVCLKINSKFGLVNLMGKYLYLTIDKLKKLEVLVFKINLFFKFKVFKII